MQRVMEIPEALSSALQHHKAGRLQEAEALYRKVLQAQPSHPGALHLLGMIAYQVGKHEVAVEYVKQAIALNPSVAEFHNNLGTVYCELGRIEAASRHLNTALQLQPDYAEAQYNLANLLRNEGKLEEAAAHYRKAIELKPDYAAAYNNLGLTLHSQGKPAEAVAHYQKALALMPDFSEAHNNLGITLADQGKLAEAVAHYQKALALKPDFAVVHGHLGNALKDQGRLEEAVVQYRLVLALRPEDAEIANQIGVCCRILGNDEEAEVYYRKAVELDPPCVAAFRNLGWMFKDQGRVDEAAAQFELAFALQPDDGLRILRATLLPAIPESMNYLFDTRRAYERQLSELLAQDLVLQDPSVEVGATNFYLAYQGCNDRDLQVKIAQLYERACPSLLYRAPHCEIGARSAHSGKVVVGFVSRYFRQHSIGKYISGLIAGLSRDKFHVVVFFVPPVKDDDLSAFIRRSADQAVVLPGALPAARERIAEEKVDVLVYPDIGMAPATYFLAFSRLAPVQCVSFGHPVTTGIGNIDYFISSEDFEPEDGKEHYSERLVRLKSPIAYYFKPKAPASLKSRSELGLDDNEHIYLCPQALFKVHPDFDEILAGILKSDPKGRLVLKAGHVQHWAELLLQRFKRTMGHAMDRITILPWLQSGDFANLIAVSDVMLDTVHFSGYTTSLEAFAVGTPVVTLPGEFQRGRHTQGLYKEMGMMDCVADSPAHYIELAVRVGTDSAFRETIKGKILARNHLLYENHNVVTEHERFFLAALKASQVRTKKKAVSAGGSKKRRASADQT